MRVVFVFGAALSAPCGAPSPNLASDRTPPPSCVEPNLSLWCRHDPYPPGPTTKEPCLSLTGSRAKPIPGTDYRVIDDEGTFGRSLAFFDEGTKAHLATVHYAPCLAGDECPGGFWYGQPLVEAQAVWTDLVTAAQAAETEVFLGGSQPVR